MNMLENLKEEIEMERRKLDEMLETMSMSDALEQSRKLDGLIEKYIDLTNAA